ncbi:MAG: hypothetical protein K6F79_01620, partial [Saccharofermentans sp.]|nr:hypothetical protein [Saccharofermentans sp.]
YLYVSNYRPDLYDYFLNTTEYYVDNAGNKGDLRHMCATLSGLIHKTDSTYGVGYGATPEWIIDDLCGWAGDYQQYIGDNVAPYIATDSEYTTVYDYVYSNLFTETTSFSMEDLYADADAVNISVIFSNCGSLSEAIEEYCDDTVNSRFVLFKSNSHIYCSLMYTLRGVTILGNYIGWPLFKDKPDVDQIHINHRHAISDAFRDRINRLIEEE